MQAHFRQALVCECVETSAHSRREELTSAHPLWCRRKNRVLSLADAKVSAGAMCGYHAESQAIGSLIRVRDKEGRLEHAFGTRIEKLEPFHDPFADHHFSIDVHLAGIPISMRPDQRS